MSERPVPEVAPEDPPVTRRRTFAIISHPDAGKTTLTEKLLLYGGAIRLAGSVKGRRAQRHATSDWMELERQRGISVTSTVLQFEYGRFNLNLLDTPGHQDFSEDTYRTLTAADSAVMLIDAAKGVEAQTIKLFKVCRMRGIPIFTFVNKLDRWGKEPLELMAELEAVLGIRSCPVNWPIGMGPEFKGVYDRHREEVILFTGGEHGSRIAAAERLRLDDPGLPGIIGDPMLQRLMEELELLDIAGDPFDLDRVRRGELTPLFFGSAITNFGVGPFLDAFLDMAPAPGPRNTLAGEQVQPDDPRFSAFVFKIQANMNPQHRDRIAFLRICSGRFERGMQVVHSRLGKPVKLAQPQQFLAQERTLVEEAHPGDIIGIFDPGIFRIGDTLSDGSIAEFDGIPQFSPEHFAYLRVRDTMKQKQFKKGLDQLSEEGVIQVFSIPANMGSRDPLVGVVGELQLDVLKFRLQFEYGVDAEVQRLPYEMARWVEGPIASPRVFADSGALLVEDADARPVVLFKGEYSLRYVEQNQPKLTFHPTAVLAARQAAADGVR